MKSTLAWVTLFLCVAVSSLPASSTGPAVLDAWGNEFTLLGTQVGENALRTQIRTTIAQLAMFDAVNAVVGQYRPFASKPPSAPGASPEAATATSAMTHVRRCLLSHVTAASDGLSVESRSPDVASRHLGTEVASGDGGP